jgi:hypothetical protein
VSLQFHRPSPVRIFLGGVLAFVCILGLSQGLQTQALTAAASKLLKSERRLRPTEISRVMQGVRTAMAGKTFRLRALPNAGGAKIEVLMRNDGRPRFFLMEHCCEIRGISEYTGLKARTCAGTTLAEELVIDFDWNRKEQRWEVEAREREYFEPDSDYFEMIASAVEAEDAGIVRGVPRSRLFVADYYNRWAVGPSRPPDNLKQSLVIDAESLLPLRWELIEAGNPTDWGVEFLDDPLISLGRPTGVRVIDCVQ